LSQWKHRSLAGSLHPRQAGAVGPVLSMSVSLLRRFALLGQLDVAEVLTVLLSAERPFEVGAELH